MATGSAIVVVAVVELRVIACATVIGALPRRRLIKAASPGCLGVVRIQIGPEREPLLKLMPARADSVAIGRHVALGLTTRPSWQD